MAEDRRTVQYLRDQRMLSLFGESYERIATVVAILCHTNCGRKVTCRHDKTILFVLQLVQLRKESIHYLRVDEQGFRESACLYD